MLYRILSRAPEGDLAALILYLTKTTSSLNKITLIVNPKSPQEMLRALDGVDAVNSTVFPVRRSMVTSVSSEKRLSF